MTSDAWCRIGAVVLGAVLLGLIAILVLIGIGLTNSIHEGQRAMVEAPCSYFASWPTERVPNRCVGGAR